MKEVLIFWLYGTKHPDNIRRELTEDLSALSGFRLKLY